MSATAMDIEEKIKELALKYNVPEQLFREIMALENDKVHLTKRKLAPKIIEAIARYTDLSQ